MAIDLLEQIFPHIKNSIYPVRESLSDWKMKETNAPNAQSVTLNDKPWISIRIPFQWGKFNQTCWFRKKIKITQPYANKSVVLLLDFSAALLYVNGKPFHGIDKNHNEILLCEKAKLDEEYLIAIEAFNVHKNEQITFATAEIAVIDPTARRLYNAITALLEVDKMMEHGSFESKEIRELIRRTLIFLKYFKPGSEEYPNAIRRGYNFLLSTLENEFKTIIQGDVHLIGQSHISTAWQWTIGETKRKCARTFSSMLRLMEEFPEFKFSQSQAFNYLLVKNNYPDLYKQIRQRISEGRWEPICSMWTEPDFNIPNGESFIRQILYAKQFLKNEFDLDSNIAWLPDSYGFNAALPQIFYKSGIKYFYTSKLTWNDTNQFPYTSFWWQGIDKTKILSHISPTGLEGQITPAFLKNNITHLQNHPELPILLQTYGYGAVGGGPSKQHIDYSVILKNINGLPSSKISTAIEFFKAIEEKSSELPVWENELYLETHRGTYTTNAWIKQQNRKLENLLYNAELLAVIALLYGKGKTAKKYPKAELETAWKKLITNQSYNIISGTAISDVYKESKNDYKDIETTCAKAIENCINSISLISKKNKKVFYFTVLNFLGWTRNEYIELTINSKEKRILIRDSEGNIIEHQILKKNKKEQTILCYVENIPPFSSKNFAVYIADTSKGKDEVWKQSTHSLETPFYKIRFDNKGAFSSLYAKFLKRELIQKNRRGNQILTFKDTPKQWDAWNIEAEAEKHKLEIWHVKQLKITESGPLRATIYLEYKSDNGSHLKQNIHFYHKCPRIDFDTIVDWYENNVLMKTAFPINLKSNLATYEIQYGAIERSTKTNTDFDRAKFEVPAQRWADISDSKYGVSLLNDCKYGYDAKENVIRLTLLRSAHAPSLNDPKQASSELIEEEKHNFRYSILPHSGDWKKANTVLRAQELNSPTLLLSNRQINLLSMLTVSKQNIVISAIKKSELDDAIIARLYESSGEPTDTIIQFGFEIKNVFECNLLETEEKEITCKKSRIHLKFKPFDIKTIKFTAKQKKRRK